MLRPKQSASLKEPPPAARALRPSHDSDSRLNFQHHQSVSRDIATSFHALHIRNIISKCIIPGDSSSGRQDGSVNDYILKEENEHFVPLPFIQWGIYMSQQTRYGPILPTLRMYPIIDDMYSLYEKMDTWTVQTFQMDMRSSLIHQFTRDRNHGSLLHVGL